MLESQKRLELVKEYFTAFNQGRTKDMLSLLHSEVEHDINQGQTEVGLEAFIKFMNHMDHCYKEELKNMTFFVAESGSKISAEYDVHGTYLKTDGQLPEARNQKYVVRAGSFFEFQTEKNSDQSVEKIKRVTTYYNLPAWINLVK